MRELWLKTHIIRLHSPTPSMLLYFVFSFSLLSFARCLFPICCVSPFPSLLLCSISCICFSISFVSRFSTIPSLSDCFLDLLQPLAISISISFSLYFTSSITNIVLPSAILTVTVISYKQFHIIFALRPAFKMDSELDIKTRWSHENAYFIRRPSLECFDEN